MSSLHASSTCYADDRLRFGTAEATPDAGDWAENELVFIRIKRDTSVTDDLNAKFLMAHVQLHYTTQ